MSEWKIETHHLRQQDGSIEIYRKQNNPNEFFSFGIHLIKIVSFLVFILFGGIILFQGFEQSIRMLFLVAFVLLLIWFLYGEITDLITVLRRNAKPILIIEKSKVHTINEQGKYTQTEVQNIKAVYGKVYTEMKGREDPKRIYFGELFFTLKNGNHLFIDVINSSKLFTPLAKEDIKEVRGKLKTIGSFIAEKVQVQFFLENKVDKASNTV